METFQAAMEKIGLSSKRSTTILVACFVTLPILLMLTVMYQNSPNFSFIGETSKVKNANNVTANVLQENPHTATTEVLKKNPGNVTANVLGNNPRNETANVLEENPHNVTADVLEENHRNISSNPSGASVQNITAGSGLGLKNVSHKDSEHKTSQSTTSKSGDKLLDGLLAPGFDEGSCLSRYQSYLYRRSKHSPSQYLISKLRAYEEYHKQCGPLTKSYKRTMTKLVKSGHKNSSIACKYIVWTPSNGLGNRMLSIAAGFLYSVLTDRVLLVDFGTSMIDLFCEPFPNSTWLLPKDFPNKGRHKQLPTYESLLKSGDTSRDKFRAPPFLYLQPSHGNEDHVKFFHCDQSQSLLREVPVIVLESDQYFVPSLFMIQFFKEELNKMFPEKEIVFHHLGRYIFQPSNEAWGLITRFYEAYLSKADERIGLQIRVFNPEKTANQTVMKEILDCFTRNKLLPQVGKEVVSSTSPQKSRTSKAVLVASLYAEYAENLRAMYWTEPTVTGEIIGVYQPSHDGFQKFNDKTQNIKAWTEIYLLSMCDELVTSAQSTFGYVAQSLGGLKPWILYKARNPKASIHSCQRDLSIEPCYHFPPRYDCATKAKLNISSSFPYMKPCKDLNWGVKMVGEK